MSAEELNRQLKFVKTFVVPQIIKRNADLEKLTLIKSEVRISEQLNGFMSNIFLVTLQFQDEDKK